MFSEIFREAGESVTVVRLSADKNKDLIIADGIVCLIDSVEGQYDHWKANLEKGNRDIRKGDILRRQDGSELEVLRNNTQKGFSFEEVTQLDLKDYDRQEPPLQENEVNMSESDLPEHELHPIIVQKVWSMFSQGNYDSAVLQAFKEVEIAVREAGNYTESDHGIPLMRKAFKVDAGNLTDKNKPSAEQEALGHLFAGAIGYCRNSLAHREVNLSAGEAVEMIFLVSYLLRIIDSRSQSEED